MRRCLNINAQKLNMKMKSHDEITQFITMVKTFRPSVGIAIDRPADECGDHWLDVAIDGFETAVRWRSMVGFGLYTTKAAFGTMPCECYRNPVAAAIRLEQLIACFYSLVGQNYSEFMSNHLLRGGCPGCLAQAESAEREHWEDCLYLNDNIIGNFNGDLDQISLKQTDRNSKSANELDKAQHIIMGGCPDCSAMNAALDKYHDEHCTRYHNYRNGCLYCTIKPADSPDLHDKDCPYYILWRKSMYGQ